MNYYIQELNYNKKSSTKVSVSNVWKPYNNLNYAIENVRAFLGYQAKKNTKVRAKGEFVAIRNEKGELVRALQLYEGKVDFVSVYSIEDFVDYIVDMNEYIINETIELE